MRLFKTQRTHRPTFLADGSLDLYAPSAWRQLSQSQLRYVLTLLSLFEDLAVVKTYMLFRLCGIHLAGRAVRLRGEWPDAFHCWVRPRWWQRRRWFTLSSWQVERLTQQFDFIDPFDSMDVRLERIHGCRAVDDILDHYPFGDYLLAEQYYQLALMSGKPEMIERLACKLYVRRDGTHPEILSLSPSEQMGTLRWFSHVKSVFAERWPHFYHHVDTTLSDGDVDLMGAMDTQIRALTDGDVTKEVAIRQLPCWRALTELNEKAREAREFRERCKHHP